VSLLARVGLVLLAAPAIAAAALMSAALLLAAFPFVALGVGRRHRPPVRFTGWARSPARLQPVIANEPAWRRVV
jgi:hypothetical protein